MLPTSPEKDVILIPFVCPVCAGENAVHLISLSRAGGHECVGCERWLRATDVMRAMHAPRPARSAGEVEEKNSRAKKIPVERPSITWPPTPESRAAVKPLTKRR